MKAAVQVGLKKKAEKCQISSDQVLLELKRMVEFDPADLLMTDKNGVTRLNPDRVNAGDLRFAKITLQGDKITIRPAFDILSALELICKLLGYFNNSAREESKRFAIQERVLAYLQKKIAAENSATSS